METYRYFSIFAILTVWALNGIIIFKWFSSKSLSLSLHAAAHRKAYFLFASSLTVNAFFFYLFALNWLSPTYNLPPVFMRLVIFALFSQFIAAWVPDIKGKLSKVHTLAAYALCLCMPVILSFIINSPKAPMLVKAIAVVANIVMISEVILLLVIDRKKSHHLIYQIVYTAVFHITLLVITFLG